MQKMTGFFLTLLFITQALYAFEDQVETEKRVQELLERALEKAAYYQEQGIENEFESKVTEISKELDDKGNVEKQESSLYRAAKVALSY